MRRCASVLCQTILLCLAAASASAQNPDAILAECASRTAPIPTPKEAEIAATVARLRGQIEARQLDQALDIVSEWIAPNPKSAPLQDVLGEVRLSRGDNDLALAAFRRAIQLDPCYARSHYDLARLQGLTGNSEAARQQLELARHLAPDDAQVQGGLQLKQLAVKPKSPPPQAAIQPPTIPPPSHRLAATPQPPPTTQPEPPSEANTVTHLKPPHFGFYAKLIDCNGIPIRAAAVVNDKALLSACQKIQLMLSNATVARQNLIAKGAELHLIGAAQNDSDLPEHRYQRGETYVDSLGQTTDIDKRTRGVGGVYSSCGEENLLHLASDRYRNGFDICIHEFAHDLMDNGFDRTIQQEIERVYRLSTGKGLWKGAYAAVNPQEYFAELSTWYFGARGNFVHDQEPAPGPAALRAYDPAGYELLDSLYSGRIQPAPAYMLVARHAAATEASGTGTRAAQLILANNTRNRYEVLWIAPDGAPSLYGKLEPYSRLAIATSITHVWAIQDDSGNPIARFQVNAPDNLATLDDRDSH